MTSGLQFGLEHSTLAGWVICGVLCVLSIASWTVMLIKLRLLSKCARANRLFLQSFRRSAHPLSLFQTRERFLEAPMYHIYFAAARELAFYLLGVDEPDASFSSRMQGAARITPSQMAAVQSAMDRAAGEASLRLESRMSVIAAALSGAPFLGLLGTVWGVMDSFSAMAGATDGVGLRALAPGVSAALLTTVVGLLVAIPSMFGYNFLVSRIRDVIVRLDHFAGDLAGIFDRHFVDHRQPLDQLPTVAAMGMPDVPDFSAAPGPAMAGGFEVSGSREVG